MTSKHTPGPWQVAEKFNCADVRAVDGPYIADCNHSAAIDWRIKEANARLIAATPELLEALIWVRDNPDDNAYWLAKVESAIAKATGEAV